MKDSSTGVEAAPAFGEGEHKFIFNLVTAPASGRGVITKSSNLTKYNKQVNWC